MALTSWKQFSFFTSSQVPVPADPDGAYIFDVWLLSMLVPNANTSRATRHASQRRQSLCSLVMMVAMCDNSHKASKSQELS